MKQEVTQVEPGVELTYMEQPTSPTTIVDLMRLAIQGGLPVETLERLQALHERVSDRNAAAEFADAVANFQAECPSVVKNRTAKVTSEQKGTKFEYKYATLPQIVRTIGPILRKHGLSYTWDSVIADGMMTCICKLRHVNGHFETASFTCPVTSGAGMSDQQKFGSASQYARRLSLIQATGLTTTDEEDQETQDPTLISDQQLSDLEALISELGLNRLRVLRFANVPELKDIRASNYDSVVAATRDYAASKKPSAK